MIYLFEVLCIIYCSYLVGAIPTGFLIAQMGGIKDIRKIGSGNIGATNVARFLGPHFFLIVLILDSLKAFLLLWFINYLEYSFAIILLSSSFLMIGNSYSIFLHGDGGKGVSTLFGIISALSLNLACVSLFIWMGTFVLIRISAVASLVSVFLFFIISFYYYHELTTFAFFATSLIFWRHHKNIRHLLKI